MLNDKSGWVSPSRVGWGYPELWLVTPRARSGMPKAYAVRNEVDFIQIIL